MMSANRRRPHLSGWWVAVAAIVSIACSQDSTMAQSPSNGTTLKPGSWGGSQAMLVVSDDEPVTLQFACASGTIDKPLAIGADGQFEWKGRYVQERPGPARAGGSEGVPAVFRGRLAGDALTLSVLVDGKPVVEPVTLEFGKRVRIVRCL
jgi:hypothetical protein